MPLYYAPQPAPPPPKRGWEAPDWLKPLSDLTIKVVVGAAAFVVAFYAAIALGVAVRFAEVHFGAPPWLVASAGVFEVLIWVGDLIVVGLFILGELLRTIGAFIAEWRWPRGK